MSNYAFHQSFYSDLAAFDADTYADPFDGMVDEGYDDGSPEPGFEHMCFDEICKADAFERDALAAWGVLA